MELISPISSLFLHAEKDLGFSPNQMPQLVPLLLTGNTIEQCNDKWAIRHIFSEPLQKQRADNKLKLLRSKECGHLKYI
jgi:hypothetical protein